MSTPRIAHVRAFTVGAGGGADYHDQEGYHWIDDHISTPMSRYPGLPTRAAAASASTCSAPWWSRSRPTTARSASAVTTGGEPGAWIVERHLARFVEGALVTDIEKIWDQMWRSTLFYGRKGLVLNVISAVDLALWDLLGRLRQEPVYHLLGGAVRDELTFYATGARPDLAQQLGFIGGKMAAAPRAARGRRGPAARTSPSWPRCGEKVGDDFWLMWDCWMSPRPRLRHPAGHRGRTSTG